MATYIVNYTSKASKSFTTGIPSRLVASHRQFDSSVHPTAIKIITYYLHNGYGNWFEVGERGDMMNTRYIRVAIEVMKGRYTDEERQNLMQRTMQCCVEYQGKHADDCEIEIRMVEVDERDVVRKPRTVIRD